MRQDQEATKQLVMASLEEAFRSDNLVVELSKGVEQVPSRNGLSASHQLTTERTMVIRWKAPAS